MRSAFLLLLVVGCHDRDHPVPASSPPPARREPPRAALLAGTTTGVVRAYDDGSLHVALGKQASCTGTRAPEIELPHRLGPDGSEQWTARAITIDRELATVNGDPHVTVRLADTATEIDLDVHAGRFDAVGTVVATRCAQRGPVFPPRTEEMGGDATMTIAGKAMKIRGAIRRGEDLVLSDAPRGCTPTWISGATLSRSEGRWTLDGERIAVAQKGDGSGLAIKLDRWTLALSGRATIGDYSVQLAGKVDVRECGPLPAKPAMTSKFEIGDDWARGETREMINCVRTGGGGYCYAHTPDGRSVGCQLSAFMARYTSESDTYVQFDWDQHLLGAPGERPECTGVQHFPSNPHPYLPTPYSR